jgi:hypothetical protein
MNKVSMFLIVSLMVISYTSCEEISEVPGGIPGMGETPGDFEIREPFVPPDGVTYEVIGGEELSLSDITGSDKAELKTMNEDTDSCTYGSGGSIYHGEFRLWITVKLKFVNNSDTNRRITLKEGLIFKVVEKGYQNGVLLHRIIFYVKAHSTRTLSILAHCVNKGRDGSNENLHYTIPGVSDSDILWEELLESLKDRKVNIENFIIPSSSHSLKTMNTDGIEKFIEIADHLQKMVWTLTNDGEYLSQEQKDYIKTIPLMEDEY